MRTDEAVLTNAEFAEVVAGAADRLAEAGVSRGDRVATCLRNGLESAVGFFACARLGAVLVALNTRLKVPQWAAQLAHSQPVLVLSHPEWLHEVKAAAHEAGMDAVYEAGEPGPGPGGALLASPALWTPVVAPHEDDTFAVLYTSGTTGRPKGVQVTHRATIHAALTYVHAFGLTSDDRSLVVLPMFYISGLVDHVIPHLLTGGWCVTVDGFHAGRVARRLSTERATWFMGVPAMVGLLLREERTFRSESLPELRLVAYGGAPFPNAWIAELRRRFPDTALCEVYGLTESHSPATMLLDADVFTHPASVGRAIPGLETRVVDDDGTEVAPGEAGEMLLRGANITPGYYRDDDANASAFVDSWFRTGDVARVDPNGYVDLLDRKKDMIQRGGFKVYSVELESLLLEHPDVVEAAIVGVPVELVGEDVVAFVVLREGASTRPASLRYWLAARVADFQVPRRLRLVGEMPRNSTGKIDKAALRERETSAGI